MRVLASCIAAALALLPELATSATVETITAPDGTKTVRVQSWVVSFAPYVHVVGYVLLVAGVSICVISILRIQAKREAKSSSTAAQVSVKRGGFSFLGKFSLEALGVLVGALLAAVGAIIANVVFVATATLPSL